MGRRTNKVTILKYHAELRGEYVHVRLWVGQENQTMAMALYGLASAGNLTMKIGEFQLFGAALSIGSRAMWQGGTPKHLKVVHTGYLSDNVDVIL